MGITSAGYRCPIKLAVKKRVPQQGKGVALVPLASTTATPLGPRSNEWLEGPLGTSNHRVSLMDGAVVKAEQSHQLLQEVPTADVREVGGTAQHLRRRQEEWRGSQLGKG